MIKAVVALALSVAAVDAAPVPREAATPRRVALVFDDGPEPVQGRALQAVLAQEAVRVTFAHVGQRVEQHPEVSREAVAGGHEIVNHSHTHARIAELDTEGVQEQVVRAQAAITTAIGAAPRWYWPPFLALDQRLADSLARADLPLYVPHHLVDSQDWNREATNAGEIRRRATTDVRDGSVLLFHEWREETIEQLPLILAELRRQGCVFLTFSELKRELRTRPPELPADERTQAQFSIPRSP